MLNSYVGNAKSLWLKDIQQNVLINMNFSVTISTTDQSKLVEKEHAMDKNIVSSALFCREKQYQAWNLVSKEYPTYY